VSAFDLNSGEVLEHWPVAFAVREVIANALDEQILTGTPDPEIGPLPGGRGWSIRDFGRGIHYRHLTQSESTEKLGHPEVIGKFGFGLNDALAVLDRNSVTIRSRHGVITTSPRAKAGFPDVVTLHGVVADPDDPEMTGTEVVLTDVSDDDVITAKGFFLRFNGQHILEDTRYGQVVAGAGAVYVKGLRVAEEPKFLFSYNVTAPDAKLSRALNRERTNVGRSAYSDRVKDILKASESAAVLQPLAADMANFDKGEAMHDELRWKDVAIHACQALQSIQKTIFVAPADMGDNHIDYAVDDGYTVLVTPNDIVKALAKLTDRDGNRMVTLWEYRRQRAESFEFDFVAPDALTDEERSVLDLAPAVAALVDFDLGEVELRISNTMRPSSVGAQEVGLWSPSEQTITIKRSQLGSAEAFCGTLLHEIGHAASGETDRTLAFEEALTDLLGVISARSLLGSQDAASG
jgi:hypothetical protein